MVNVLQFQLNKFEQDHFLRDVLNEVKQERLVLSVPKNKHLLGYFKSKVIPMSFKKAGSLSKHLLNYDLGLICSSHTNLWNKIKFEVMFLILKNREKEVKLLFKRNTNLLSINGAIIQMRRLKAETTPEYARLTRKYVQELVKTELQLAKLIKPDLEQLIGVFLANSEHLTILPKEIKLQYAKQYARQFI